MLFSVLSPIKIFFYNYTSNQIILDVLRKYSKHIKQTLVKLDCV